MLEFKNYSISFVLFFILEKFFFIDLLLYFLVFGRLVIGEKGVIRERGY